MWTPKRVLILLGGFVLFSVLFGFYSHFLGHLDGLPQLPERYLPGDGAKIQNAPPTQPEVERLIQAAFGEECEELQRPIRINLHKKGLIFCTKKFEVDTDKRVKLTPFSAVVYGKTPADGSFPEINTVRSDFAYLTLDEPVESLSEVNNRKIKEIELVSNLSIKITNNHRTPQTSDDVNINISNGSLFYKDDENRIWTEGFVEISDFKTTPETTVKAQGMEIFLAKEGTQPKSKTAGKSDSVNGVETIRLKSHVEMHLYMDPASGFLADSQNTPGKSPGGKSAAGEKAHVIIRTDGPFHYNLPQENAKFLSDKASRGNPDVHVQRVHKTPGTRPGEETVTKFDEIRCEELDLHFRQKPAVGDKKAEKGSDKEIETAVARGKEVQVDMASENIHAVGYEMTYRTAEEDRGKETTIKGQPMFAIKDGHVIEAPELLLVGGDKKGLGQKAEAHGKGHIDMFDSAKKSYPQHAYWTEDMSFTKISKNGMPLDLMILKGNAQFKDDEHLNDLRAQELYVWLEPADKTAAPVPGSTKTPQSGPMGTSKLHQLEASKNVKYDGPDMHIEHCEFLVIKTRDKPAETLPRVPVAEKSPASGKPDRPGAPGAAPSTATPGGAAAVPPGTEPPREQKARPIKLSAREVRVNVLRSGPVNEMENLVAEENVHVTQEGESAKDKGVDIRGHLLNLVQTRNGKILYVDGDDKATDSRKYGRLLMNDMLLVGPKISINQADNVAEAKGQGYLNMASNANLDGTKTAKADSRMTVYWTDRMEFNGKTANFYGGVQAEQENSKLRCENMQVTMEGKGISFKEGQKDAQAAKMEKILCDRQVYVVEKVLDERTHVLVRQQKGQFHQLDVDNADGRTKAAGPGYVAAWSKESSDGKSPSLLGNGPANASAKAPAKKTEETKLTRVEFSGRLFSITEGNTRKSTFYDNVEVYHLPAAHPEVAINRTKPPKDGFYLKCDLLKVFSRPVAGKNAQYMEARHRVNFHTDEFYGRADIVKFDEADDIIIFEANPGNIVTITKIPPGGGEGQRITGEKVLYNRKTGEFQLDGVREIRGRS